MSDEHTCAYLWLFRLLKSRGEMAISLIKTKLASVDFKSSRRVFLAPLLNKDAVESNILVNVNLMPVSRRNCRDCLHALFSIGPLRWGSEDMPSLACLCHSALIIKKNLGECKAVLIKKHKNCVSIAFVAFGCRNVGNRRET